MPIYEYQCTQCGHVQEVLQKVSDKPLTRCTQCSGKMHKLISQSSFHLKGTGWYVTDYAKKSGKAKEVSKTKNDTAAKSGDASATGSESSSPSQKSNSSS